MSRKMLSLISHEDPVRRAIVSACRYFMQPIARFLMKNGVTFKEFAEVAKLAFVEVATNEYGLRNRPTNISRTAVLTGLTRKEVKRIRETTDFAGEYSPRELGRPAQILSLWFSNPQFLGEDGKPRSLEFEGDGGFRDLCRLGGGDVPPGALLTELKRAKAAEEADDGKIRALKRHYNPAGIDEFQATRFGECLHDLADTVEFNLGTERPNERRFESRVWNDKISLQFANRFQMLAREHGQAILATLDDWLTAHESKLPSSQDLPLRRCGVGIYFFDGSA
jgi:hypothetical protein